jgi:hypothetical protein
MRDRMTGRREPKARSVMAEIERLEAILAVDEEGLKQEADELADEEVDIAEESTGEVVSETEDQNEMAMENWPVDDRQAVASRLLKMAKLLLS